MDPLLLTLVCLIGALILAIIARTLHWELRGRAREALTELNTEYKDLCRKYPV